MKEWLIIEHDETDGCSVSVIPHDDIARHDLSLLCRCFPVIENSVMKHNSYDNREVWEALVEAGEDSRNVR